MGQRKGESHTQVAQENYEATRVNSAFTTEKKMNL